MRFNRQTLLCLLVVLHTTQNAVAQDTSVFFGRVAGSDHGQSLPPDWRVAVSIERKGHGKESDSPRNSQREIYCYKVLHNTTVRLIFEAPYYRATATEWIVVGDEKSYSYRVMPDVVLTRIQLDGQPGQQGMTPQQLERELEDQAGLAMITGSGDILKLNIEVYRQLSRALPQHKAVVERIEANPQYRNLMVKAPELRPGVLRNLTRVPSETAPETMRDLLGVIGSPTVFPGIREKAVENLIMGPLPSEMRSDAVAYFRQEVKKPSSDILLPSFTALVRLGNPADQQTVIGELKSAHAERVMAAIEALAQADSPATSGALIDIARNSSSSSFKTAAVTSLGAHRGELATKAVIDALAFDASVAVRLAAARILAAIESPSPATERALKSAATSDASAEVRILAKGAIKK